MPRAAMEAVFAEVFRWPGVTGMRTCVPEPGGPEAFYLSLGFRPNGRMNDDEAEVELRFG